MAEFALGINPTVLKWARIRAGLSIEDISLKFKKSKEVISSWESGELCPTYTQLETLAYIYYKRPIAIFFFPEPPDEKDPKKSFRTLPVFELENLSSDTLYAIRQASAMQISLQQLTDNINPFKRIFNEFDLKTSNNIVKISNKLRRYLKIELKEQIKWSNSQVAFRKWRNIVEENGIFIFKRSFKQNEISGFCLTDKVFPIIYLNNSSSSNRQIFSIFHELAHILLNENGITKTYDDYISSLHGRKKKIEIFCNQFASEFLVPTDDFTQFLNLNKLTNELFIKLSKRYSVSREVILRKYLDNNKVTQGYYERKTRLWNEEYKKFKKIEKEKNKEKPPKGIYFPTQISYLGDNYLQLAFSQYYKGNIGREQLANHLNIKVKSIDGLEEKFIKRVVAK